MLLLVIMKKVIYLSLFLLIGALNLNAQGKNSFKFGILGGVSSYNISPDEVIIKDENGTHMGELAFKNANYGMHFGIFLLAKSNFLFIKPQLQFNSQTVSYSYEAVKTGDVRILNENYQNIDVPVQLGLNLGPIRIGVGPVGHIHINGSSDFYDLKSVDYEQEFKEMTLGYVMGVGLDVWNFHADISYEGNFTDMGSHMQLFGRDIKFHTAPARFLLTLGVSF